MVLGDMARIEEWSKWTTRNRLRLIFFYRRQRIRSWLMLPRGRMPVDCGPWENELESNENGDIRVPIKDCKINRKRMRKGHRVNAKLKKNIDQWTSSLSQLKKWSQHLVVLLQKRCLDSTTWAEAFVIIIANNYLKWSTSPSSKIFCPLSLYSAAFYRSTFSCQFQLLGSCLTATTFGKVDSSFHTFIWL